MAGKTLILVDTMKIRLNCEQKYLDFILNYLSPYIEEVTDDGNIDIFIEVFEAQKKQKKYNNSLLKDIDIHYDQRGKIFTNGEESYLEFHKNCHSVLFTNKMIRVELDSVDENRCYIPMRIIREILYQLYIVSGFKEYHSSAFEIDGKGVLVFGDKGAGKTTLLLRMLKEQGAKFISNDKVFYNKETGIIFGYPLSLNIRKSSHDVIPELRELEAIGSHYNLNWSREKYTVTINDVLQLFKCQANIKAELSNIIILDDDVEGLEKRNSTIFDKFYRVHPFQEWSSCFSRYITSKIITGGNKEPQVLYASKFIDTEFLVKYINNGE